MRNSQTARLESRSEAQRYLPEHLWTRWQAGDTLPGLSHLRALLQAVLTYLPRRVAQARLANPQSPAVTGTFAQATLVFADISGFTAMSERLTQLGREGAEVITSIVNDYFATMLEAIARHGGDLFKFSGDALLVCFSGEGAPANACRAALEMQAAMARFALIESAQGTFHLRMKIGLGTGTLFLASLGAPGRLEFAVMGPALGRMARAESIAEAGEVLMDGATFGAVAALVAVDERSPGFYHLRGVDAIEIETEPRFPPATLVLEEITDADWLVQRLDALTPYLPPRLLEQIIVSPRRRMIEGEHRLVTVMFANFYGIDEIIQALGPGSGRAGPGRPDELTAILNAHFTAMQGIIHKYGGIVNKVDSYAVGYRIMAVFGAPAAHEDDPARAVHAALEMQAAVESLTGVGGVSTSAGRFALKQRIGVNTGYVFAGNLGSKLRQEYSVMGDEVNLAARLTGIASAAQVLISQATARHVQGLFEWREREPVKVKGKRQPVQSYQVRRSVSTREGRVTPRRGFFDRQKELGAARALVDAALARRGAVLDVSGGPGVGKSRLMEELSAYAGQRGMVTLRGEAVSYGRNIPYLIWTAILHRLFEFQEGERTEWRRDKLVNRLKSAGLSEWAPIVGGVLGVDVPESPLTASLDAQLRQQRFFDVVLRLIQGQAGRTPLLLVLDDVQWADAVSLDLVTYVARNVTDSSLLLGIVHRPDLASAPWRVDDKYHVLQLAEIEEGDSMALARSVLGGEDLAPSLRRLILDRAQGNPLFVEEVARTLSESGAIRLEPGGEGDGRVWSLAQAGIDVEVPTTLTGLIMSRIDQLETTNRRLLQVASVVGVAFRSPVLARVYPYEDVNGTLPRRLAELVQLDLTSFAPPDEYIFKHTLTQEVAYESLPFARRRELHVRVGKDIEHHHAGELAEYYGVLARHFDEGRFFDRAFTYMVKAGDKARAEFANEDALGYYRRALEISAGLGAEVEGKVLGVLEVMGDVFLLVSRYAEAIEQYQQAVAHRSCTARHCADLLCKLAKAHELQGQYDEALPYLAQGRWVLSGDERTRRSSEMARICNLSGWIHMRRGEMDRAIKECEQGLAILAGLAHDAVVLRDEANLYNTLGAVYIGQGDYSQADQVYQRSTDLRQQAGDLPGLARSYNNLAAICWGRGDLAGVSDYLQRSLEINHQIGDNYGLAFGYNNLGAVNFMRGDAERALDNYRTALSLRQRIGDSYGVAQTCSNVGEAYLSLGQYDAAHRYLEQSAGVFEAIQSEGELPEVYCLLAEVELAREEISSSLEYAERARRIAAAAGNLEWQGRAERALARGQARSGDVNQAVQFFEASTESLREAENQVELARSHYELGSLLAATPGREAPAREHLRQAADLFDAAGSQEEAERARAALV